MTPSRSMLKMSFALGVITAAMLTACSTDFQLTSPKSASRSPSADCAGDLGAATNTKLDTVQQMIEGGKPYAALAELDALQAQTPKARYLRAEALRRVDHPVEAEQLYKQLLDTCLAGRARHGMGLMAAKAGHMVDAIDALQQARHELPTDAAIRNDLGYALLLNWQLDAARFELLTALDLAPADQKAARNLVLLTLIEGHPESAQRLADKFSIDAAAVERLSRQARDLRGAGQQQPGAAPAAPLSPPSDSGKPVAPLTPPASDAS